MQSGNRNKMADGLGLYLKILVMLASLWRTSAQTVYAGNCKADSVATPQFTRVIGYGYNKTITSASYCKYRCLKFGFPQSAVENSSFCFCAMNATDAVLTVTTGCVACSNVTTEYCGAELTLSLYSLSTGVPSINLTVVGNPSNFTSASVVTISVGISGPTPTWLVDWGDGSTVQTNNSTHIYIYQGIYLITVYPLGYPRVSAQSEVKVQGIPQYNITCANITEIFTPLLCNVTSYGMGYDFQLDYNITNTTTFQSLATKIPDEILTTVGGSATVPNISWTAINELANGYILIGNSYLSKGGYIVRAIGNANAAGSVNVYTATPKCTTGSYCGLTGDCRTSCPVGDVAQLCTDSFCSVSSSCKTSTCPVGESPLATPGNSSLEMVFQLLTLLSVPAGVFDFYLPVPTWVPDGSRLALGCPSASCSSPTILYDNLPWYPAQVVPSDVFYFTNSSPPVKLNKRLSLRFVIRHHQHVNMTPDVKCEAAAPVPVAEVPLPFSASTEAYIYQGKLNLSYSLFSPSSGVSVDSALPLLCQQRLLVPTFTADVWMPYGTPYYHLIQFSQGSPLFSEFDVDGIMKYDYYDDALLGYTLNLTLTYAKEGLYHLIGNTSNALGEVSYSSVVHVVPPITDNWNVTVFCPCYDIPSNFNLTAFVSTYPAPIWNATVTISLVDQATGVTMTPLLVDQEVIDFNTFNITGFTGPINFSYGKTTTQAGNYSLIVTISNEVSNTTLNQSVEVQEGIRDVNATFKWDSWGKLLDGMGAFKTIFLANFTTYFWLDSRTGYPDNWKITINETGEEIAISDSSVGNLSYVFPEDGTFTLVFWGYNTVQGWVPSPPYQFIIVSKLKGLSLSSDPRVVKPGETKTVLCDFEIFTPLSCLIIDFGDNSPPLSFGYEERCKVGHEDAIYQSEINPPASVTHIYQLEGIYTIRGVAFDHNVDNIYSAELTTVIADLPCTSPTVHIVDASKYIETAPTFMRSLKTRFETTAQYQCNKTVPVSRWWTILKVNGTNNMPIKDVPIKDIVSSWNFSQLSLPNNFLEWGIYKLTYNFRLLASAVFPLESSDFTYINITKTPLTAQILEGYSSAITRGFGQMVLLNSTWSMDPDYPDDRTSLDITWWCRQLSPRPPTIPLPTPGADYPVINTQQIPAPLSAAAKFPNGASGCFGADGGDGTLDTTDRIINLNAASFVIADKAKYQIILKTFKDTRLAYATLTIEVLLFPPPSVLIKCDPSLCFASTTGLIVNPNKRLALVGSCTSDCPEVPQYKWNITTASGDPVNIIAPCETEPPPPNDPLYVCEKALLTPTDTTELAMSPSFFAINPTVDDFKIRLSIKNKNDPKADEGYSEILVTRNKPPKDGTCAGVIRYGYAMITRYPVICSGWSDPEGLGIDYYAFYHLKVKDGVTTKTTLASTSQPTVDLILPVGDFDMYADAVDLLEGSITLSLGNFTAILPNQTQIDAFNYPANIQYLSSIGDQTTLAMLLGAISSIRDNAAWLSIDEAAFQNMTSSEQNGRLINVAELNNNQLKVVRDTMDFATLAQLEVGANVVQKALEGIFNAKTGSLTVDIETKDIALDVLEKMSNKIGEVGVKSPTDFKGFLAKVMDSFAALICSIDQVLLTGENDTVVPLDVKKSVTWDYDTDIGFDENMEVPADTHSQLEKNVLETARVKAKTQVEKIYRLLHKTSLEVQRKCLPGEQVEAQAEHGATVITGRTSEVILESGLTITASQNLNTSVVFPERFCPSKYVLRRTDCTNKLGFSVFVWPCISRLYPATSKYLSLETRTVDVDVNLDGEFIDVTNESIAISLDIPRRNETLAPPVAVNTSEVLSPHVPVVYHKFNIDSPNSGYTLEISPYDPLPSNLIFLVGNEHMPILSKYDYAVLLNSFQQDAAGVFSYFVDSLRNKNKTGRFFVGIGALRKSLTKIDNTTVLQKSDFDENFRSKYNFRVYISGCYSYEPAFNRWSSTGLTLISATPEKTSCKTVHMSTFAGRFSSTPISLDFEYIFSHGGLIDNLPIYITLIVVTCLYVISMIWAHWMDRKDIVRRGAVPLLDNKPSDKYLYEITFHTGPDKEATTTSNIFFIASGDYGETEVRRLPPSTKHLYRRYNADTFVMAVPKPLGHVNFLRVFHDNSGEPPLDTWQLQMVVVRDLQTGNKSAFHTSAWLAFNRDEGQVDKIFTCSDGDSDKGFIPNLYVNTNKIMNEDNMYMSVFLRRIGSRYGRKERVTVCAVYLYLSMFLAAFIYDQKEETPRNGYFDYGILTLSTEQLITGAFILLVAYPVTIALTFVFKRARPRNLKRCRAVDAIEKQRQSQLEENGVSDAEERSKVEIDPDNNTSKPKDKSPVRCIPWWSRLLAWVVALAIIGLSAFMVWSYGIKWGEIRTVKWISSFIVCFLISVLITQWLKIFIMSIIFSSCFKTDQTVEDIDCDEELPNLKHDEEWTDVKFVDPSVRKKVHKVEGVDIDKETIAELRKRLMKEREMSIVLKGIMVYGIFLAVIYTISNGRTDYNAFILKAHLEDTLIKSGDKIFDFKKKINTEDDWWNWAKNVILQEIRAQRAYNNDPPYGLRGYMNDKANRLLGYAIIRQVRTKRYTCATPVPMDSMIPHCTGSRGPEIEESKDFCAGWAINETFPGACRWPEFQYKSAQELKTYPTEGKLGMYGGGGYVFRLSGRQEDLVQRMDELQRKQWIDRNTRAVILEFSIYNVNVNLFATCKVNAEFSEAGGIVPNWRFEPIRLIEGSGLILYITYLCYIIFVVATAFSTLNELWEMKKQKFAYFQSYWNIAELCLVADSYTAIGLYVYRLVLTKEALELFEKTKGNGYVRIDSAAIVDQYFLYTIAVLVFFSTLKLIKLLQFNRRMNSLAMTIGSCWEELKIFLIAFFIAFFAFACIFYFIFRSSLDTFLNILEAVQTTFQMMMGKFDLQSMSRQNSLSPILFFLFSLLNSMILMNIMLTIIIQAFNVVKEDIMKHDNRLNVLDHVWYVFKVFLRKENLERIDVTPVLTDKQENNRASSSMGSGDSEALPDKVSQLLTYINDVYFDGRLDMNDPNARKSVLQGPLSAPAHQFRFRTQQIISKRNVLISDE